MYPFPQKKLRMIKLIFSGLKFNICVFRAMVAKPCDLGSEIQFEPCQWCCFRAGGGGRSKNTGQGTHTQCNFAPSSDPQMHDIFPLSFKFFWYPAFFIGASSPYFSAIFFIYSNAAKTVWLLLWCSTKMMTAWYFYGTFAYSLLSTGSFHKMQLSSCSTKIATVLTNPLSIPGFDNVQNMCCNVMGNSTSTLCSCVKIWFP